MRKLLFFTLILTFIFVACGQLPKQPEEKKSEKYQKHLSQYLSQEPIIQPDGSMIFRCPPLVMSGTIEALTGKIVDAVIIYDQLTKEEDGSVMPNTIIDSLISYGVSSDFSLIGHGLESEKKKTKALTDALKEGKTVLCIVQTIFKPTGEVMPHYYLILGYKSDMEGVITFFAYDSYLDQDPDNPLNPLITVDTNGDYAGNMSISPEELFTSMALISYGPVNTFWIINSVE